MKKREFGLDLGPGYNTLRWARRRLSALEPDPAPRRRPLRTLIYLVIAGLLLLAPVTLATPAAAQSPVWLWTPPLAISRDREGNAWPGNAFGAAEPAGEPAVAVTANGKVHVMWVGQRSPVGQPLWYSQSVAATEWQTATLMNPALGVSKPRLYVDPQVTGETVHAVWVETVEKENGTANVINYSRGPGERCAPGDCEWPLPLYSAVFNACPPLCAADQPSLFVTQRGLSPVVHVVWNERRSGSQPPLLISGVVSDTWKTDPNALVGQVPADDYVGDFPSVTLGPSGEKRLLWEGRSLSYPNQRVVKWGYNQGNGGSISWTTPRRVSTTLLKLNASLAPTCEQRDATAPSITVAPNGDLYAVWHEQGPDCMFSILSSRLNTTTQEWTDTEEISGGLSQAPGATAESLSPRLVFDRAGRRYVMWNRNYTDILLRGEDQDGAWQTVRLNAGECEGQPNVLGWKVHAFDLAMGPDGTLHAVWTALLGGDAPLTQGKICYATIRPSYRVFLPVVGNRTHFGLGH